MSPVVVSSSHQNAANDSLHSRCPTVSVVVVFVVDVVSVVSMTLRRRLPPKNLRMVTASMMMTSAT